VWHRTSTRMTSRAESCRTAKKPLEHKGHVPSRPYACMKGDDPLQSKEVREQGRARARAHTKRTAQDPSPCPRPQDRPAGDEPPGGTGTSLRIPSRYDRIIGSSIDHRGACGMARRFQRFVSLPTLRFPPKTKVSCSAVPIGNGWEWEFYDGPALSRRVVVQWYSYSSFLLRCSEAIGAFARSLLGPR
jgi:hypothetical protein